MTSLAEAALQTLSRAPSQNADDTAAAVPVVAGDPTEVLFFDRYGWEPLGLVTGAAVFHVGLVGWPRGNTEVEQLSQAMYGARERAIAGLVDQARDLGADGVVNATIDVHFMEDDRHLPRFVATGTAVGRRTHHESTGDDPPLPFVTTMTTSQVGLLGDSGFRPLGVVMGSCVYHVGRQDSHTWARNLRENRELVGYTDALYDARELAMARLQEEAQALSAAGVVGVVTAERSHVWGSRVIEFFALGNAVADVGQPAAKPSPGLTVDLNDPRSVTDPAAIHEEASER